MKRKKLLISLGAIAFLNLYTIYPKESSANDVTHDSMSRSANMVVSTEGDHIEANKSQSESKNEKNSDSNLSSLDKKEEQSTKSSVRNSNTRSVNGIENQTTTGLPFSGYVQGNQYMIVSYTGNSLDINVPSTVEGKSVILKQGFLTSLPVNLTRLTFAGDKGITLENNSFTGVFRKYKNLQMVDLSGINMDSVQLFNQVFQECSSLQSVKFGNNDLHNVINISGAFEGCRSLTQVEGKWNLNNVTNAESLFKDCNNLTSVDTSLWGFQNNTTLAQLFSNCWSINHLDTSSWNTSRVTSLYTIFQNCSSLENIDVTNWDVSHVTTAENSFVSTQSITELNMVNWHFPENVNLNNWMYSVKLGKDRKLILTNDNQILKYNYDADWCLPMGPYIDSGGGEYTDLNPLPESPGWYSYLNSPAIKPDNPKLTNFKVELKEFLSKKLPIRSGYAFTDWSNNMISVDDASTYKDLFDTTYTAHWVSANYSTSEDNKKFDVLNQSLAFAYLPKEFGTGSTSILSEGKQEIPLQKKQSFNIGVKDRTRNHDTWYVTAQLRWTNPVFNSAYIQTENNLGTVKQNISTGLDAYNPSTQLVSQTSGVLGQPSIKIESSHANPIIVSNSLLDKNAVYDYDLGNAKLVIPETENIPVDSYQGEVEWNLISAP